MAQVPVPTEDQVVAHVHIDWRDGQRLAERVRKAKVDLDRRPQPLLATRGCSRHGPRARLARRRKAQSSCQVGTDDSVCSARVQEDRQGADVLQR
jgi:hypothetical protein